MLSCYVSCTPESSQQINSQESRPSLSKTEKAIKYGIYGTFALGLGIVSVMVIDEVQSHFNQPVRDFYCFSNITAATAYNAQNKFSRLLSEGQFGSLFTRAVITGSIIVVSNILYNLGERLFYSQFPFSDTVNQPAHRPSAEELTNINEHSTKV